MVTYLSIYLSNIHHLLLIRLSTRKDQAEARDADGRALPYPILTAMREAALYLLCRWATYLPTYIHCSFEQQLSTAGNQINLNIHTYIHTLGLKKRNKKQEQTVLMICWWLLACLLDGVRTTTVCHEGTHHHHHHHHHHRHHHSPVLLPYHHHYPVLITPIASSGTKRAG